MKNVAEMTPEERREYEERQARHRAKMAQQAEYKKNRDQEERTRPCPYFGVSAEDYYRDLNQQEVTVSLMPDGKSLTGLLLSHQQYDIVILIGDEVRVLIPKHSIRFIRPAPRKERT